MNTFLRKIAFFLIVYLIISIIISWFTPFYWGNPWIAAKVNAINKRNNQSFNTYFIGSSRVYRQISPLIFDSIVKNSKSYNLGAPATFPMQTYYIAEKMISKKLLPKNAMIFIELADIGILSDNLMHQERSNYWLTPAYWTSSVNTILFHPHLSLKDKQEQIKNYTISFIENSLHIGHFREQILFGNNLDDTMFVGYRGFFPLNKELRTTSDSLTIHHLLMRKSKFTNDTSVLLERKNKVMALIKTKDAYPYSKTHLKKIQQLIKIATSNNYNVYFLLLPRYTSKEAFALYTNISEKHRIELVNPKKFPEFYLTKYAFDIGHLNNKGAKVLTHYLANEVQKKNIYE